MLCRARGERLVCKHAARLVLRWPRGGCVVACSLATVVSSLKSFDVAKVPVCLPKLLYMV